MTETLTAKNVDAQIEEAGLCHFITETTYDGADFVDEDLGAAYSTARFALEAFTSTLKRLHDESAAAASLGDGTVTVAFGEPDANYESVSADPPGRVDLFLKGTGPLVDKAE